MDKPLTLEMIRARAAEAERAIRDAKHVIDNRTRELADLEAASRVFALLHLSDTAAAQSTDSAGSFLQQLIDTRLAERDDFDPNERQGNPYKPGTNKAFMWHALRDAREVWLTANQLQVLASRVRGDEIPMSSVSPGLTDMKKDGTIERDGLKVALKIRLETKDAPEAEAADAS